MKATIKTPVLDRKRIIDNACLIIARNFGQTTADMYHQYYSEKETEEVLDSVKELMVEAVGPKNAAKQLKNLK